MDTDQQLPSPESAFFELLTDIVKEYYQGGRRCVGASLKPALAHRSHGAFSERSLGYRSFKAFLEAASDQGLVSLVQWPASSDVEVLPPGATQPATASSWPGHEPRAPRPRRRIRADLWRAFVNWDSGLVRVFDRDNRRAIVFPEREGPFDLPQHRAARDAWAHSPASLIPIHPIGREGHLSWMRDFADGLANADLQRRMREALRSEKPAGEFMAIARTTPGLAASWNHHRFQCVEREILHWTAKNGLSLDIYEHGPQEREAADVHGGASDEEQVRRLVQSAVEKMTLPELLRLPIPLEYVIAWKRS